MDGLAEGDLDGLGDREGEGRALGVGESDASTGGGTTTGVWLTAEEGFAVGDAGAVVGLAAAVVGAVAGLLVGALTVGRAARAPSGWEPAKMNRTAAMTHTAATHATKTSVVVAGRRPRMLLHVTSLMAAENRVSHVHSARRTTRRRYALASGLVEEHARSTRSLSSVGSGVSGSRPQSAAGRSAPSR